MNWVLQRLLKLAGLGHELLIFIAMPCITCYGMQDLDRETYTYSQYLYTFILYVKVSKILDYVTAKKILQVFFFFQSQLQFNRVFKFLVNGN